MKRLIHLTGLIGILFTTACGDRMIKNKTKDAEEPADHTAAPVTAGSAKSTTNVLVKNEQDLHGYWVGKFEPDTTIDALYTGEYNVWDYSNKINISIDQIEGGSQVTGHSVVAGNDRPFKGILKKSETGYHFVVKEPGDDRYDGAFDFEINIGDSLLVGTWKANKKIRIPARKYALSKKIFVYNPDWQMKLEPYVDWNKKKRIEFQVDDDTDYDNSYFATTKDLLKYNASKELLTKEQVANLKKADLFILRNSIYARHGYSFKNQQLRAYFDKQDWYIPISTNVKTQFTDLEKQNSALLLRYEKNAKEYYDVFGRG